MFNSFSCTEAGLGAADTHDRLVRFPVRRAFVELMDDLQAYSLTHTPAELLDYVLKRCDYAAMLKVCRERAAVKHEPCCASGFRPYPKHQSAMASTAMSLTRVSAICQCISRCSSDMVLHCSPCLRALC